VIGPAQVSAWLDGLAAVYATHKQRLTELDSAIGDADHGTNMERGFTAVVAGRTDGDIRALLQSAAMVLIKTVGGAAGPLYGTFFLRAATACAGKAELAPGDLVALFQAGTEGIQQRGKAVAGEKTMLDALLPAAAAMREVLDRGEAIPAILDAGAAAAEAGMRATIPMQATKGRASYLGERSVGHQDPGATSAYLLLKTAAETWRE
jgi:dihydroxyacetone kinase-like protein